MAKKKVHPADLADQAAIQKAKYFTAFLRRSPTSKILERADTLAEVVAIADRIRAENKGRNVLVYAVTVRDNSIPVPDDMQAAARAGEIDIVPNKPKAKGPRKAPKAARASKRGAIEEAAKAGTLPPAPDFSADTHKPYRKRLAEIVAMAEAGDVKGLQKLEIKAYSSSPKALARYRDLAVMALKARRSGGGSPGEEAAIYAEEAGIPYSEALVACNMD